MVIIYIRYYDIIILLDNHVIAQKYDAHRVHLDPEPLKGTGGCWAGGKVEGFFSVVSIWDTILRECKICDAAQLNLLP